MNANLLKGPLGYAVVIGVGGLVVWLLWNKVTALAKDTADTVGGLATGNNAITAGTVYEGAGVAGTLGSAANKVSGGVFEDIGSWLGGKLADWTIDDPNVKTPILQTRKQAVGNNALDLGWFGTSRTQ